MNPLCVVVGTGARTPLGLNAVDSAFLYRAGHAGMREAAILDENDEPTTMCLVPTLQPYATGVERAIALGAPALAEALGHLGPLARELRIKVVVGVDVPLAPPTPGMPDDADQIGAALRAVARQHAHEAVALEVIRGGAAGPGLRLEALAGELAAGTGDVIVLGGVHTDHDLLRVRWLEKQGRLFASGNLDALIPGEGAAFVLLADPRVARRLQLPELARILGTAAATERARPDNDESAFEALGLTAAVRKVLTPLGDDGPRVGWMLSDLTFEMRQINEWQAVSMRHQKYLCEPQYTDFPAHRMGHLGAYALPFELTLVAEAWQRGFGPHTHALLLVGNDSGERVAVLATAGAAADAVEPLDAP